jgi:hypothetical protein
MMIPSDLTEKFHPSMVKKNQSNQDYVAINQYINRLNDVLGALWSWSVNDWKIMDAPPTKSGKPQYTAIVQGTLMIVLNDIGVVSVGEGDDDAFLTTQRATVARDGIGANTNFDPDTAVKSAQAEALKKACHQFGIALYLWESDERDYVELQRQAVTNDGALQKLVVLYTQQLLELDPGVMPSADQMLEVLDMSEWNTSTARTTLTKKGII